MLAFLGACAAPTQIDPRQAQPECVFGEGDVIPLQGPGLNVVGSLNDQPVAMEVNTGLGLTSLLPEVAQRLRLPEDPVRHSSYPSSSGPVTRRNVLSRSLRVGGQEWSGRSLAVRPFFGAGGGAPGFDGVLGADLLRQGELEIDLPGRRVAIHRTSNCRPAIPPWPSVTNVVMEVRGIGVPVITVRVNGQPVRARIQSGNNASTMSQALANRLALRTPTGRQGSTFGSDSAGQRGREYRLDEIAVGGEVLRHQLVFVTADQGGAEEELILGRDWLRYSKVWFSFTNRRLFMARPAG
jgi:hypothetical protein